MKKILLSAALLAAATGAVAETFEYGYCSTDIVDYWGAVSGASAGAAIEIPADVAATWEGYKIVGMKVGFGDGSQIIPFIAKDFNKYNSFLDIFKDPDMLFPICDYSEGAPTPGSSKNKAEFKITTKNGWNEVSFTTPYVIDGESFKIGYYVQAMTDIQRPVGTDGSKNAAANNWFAFGNGGVLDLWNNQWKNTTEYGNMSIRLIIDGDSAPADMASIRDFSIPVVTKPGEPFSVSFEVSNDAFNDITSIGGNITIGQQTPVPFAFTPDEPIAQLGRTTFTVNDLVCENESNEVTVTIDLTTVNGERNNGVIKSVSGTMSCAEAGFARTVVFEEVTGNWCKNCPSGIVAFRNMNEKYPDTFIGIAVHTQSGDPMISSDFSSFAANYSSVPSGTMNRKKEMYPSPSALEEAYTAMHDVVYARLEMDAVFGDESRSNLNITTTTEYAINHPDIDYAIAYIITENNVGPYMQENGFAGGSLGEMGGFENMDSRVPLLYNDVARCADGLYGLSQSVMTEASAGDKIPFEHNMTVRNVTNKDNMELIGLLLDRKSGEIVNAARLRAADIKSSGIVTVTDNDDAPAEYYNLQGIRVTRPVSGNVYICRKGAVTSKVIF